MHRKPTIQRACDYCGALYTPIRQSAGLYCSRACSGKGRTRPLAERFWAKVDKNGPVPAHRPELGPCWLWTGAVNNRGYGYLGGEGGRNGERLLAHRFSYELANGPLPAGLKALHRCDNPPCVNNETHLFSGTQTDNMRDCAAKGRIRVPRSGTPSERNRHAKLTWPKVREIRRLKASTGATNLALGRQFGVSAATVSQIVTGDTWRE